MTGPGVYVDPFTGQPLPLPTPVPTRPAAAAPGIPAGRDEAVYEVRCKKCGARPGQPCTYVGRPVGRYQREADPRRGLPTLRPHQERRDARFRKENDAARRALAHARTLALADPVAAERRALADLARQEHAQMRDWLARHGRVLTDPPSPSGRDGHETSDR